MSSVLRKAAEQALEALEHENTMVDRGDGHWEFKHDLASAALRAALAEHFCDTHCTWADHAPGCVRAEPVHDDAVYWYVGTDGKYYSSHEAELFLDANTKALHKKPPQWRLDKGDLIPLVAYRPPITITGTYQEFVEFVRMACMHETIYEDSEGRDILVIRVLDAYGMAHSWAMEHTRNNLS